ncbi:TnsA-like heteromeric transposase endonuclease subunit [Diaminobutyricimonas sp. LJ205]|uniref:TnsA-like heteromeric transposase endonuclease subunit n=1 Tax=Diaminobutyricimonas sp. LJ205 TaxID=2683590 RepID=UPI0012F50245|nr:TnsA-like heteromeric transposase endonuclease subunit [Diaminobutyricimonas sp. LJ205]
MNNSLTQAAEAAARSASLQWKSPVTGLRAKAASPALLLDELYLASPIRTGNRYPRQRNYHGHHYFAQTGALVEHESLLEATTLAWLDMHCDIVAIAAQPMKMTFADGSVHFPDFFALHGDYSQVVYDVKPKELITEKVQLQFAKTRALCARIGWEYEVHSELPNQVRVNLNWISAFKHHGYHPGAERTAQLTAALTEPLPLKAAAELLQQARLPDARAALYHLVWNRELRLDLTQRLSDRTLIERNTNAHA